MLRRRRREGSGGRGPEDAAPVAPPPAAPGAEDLAAYRAIGSELRAAVLRSLPGWLEGEIERRGPGIDPSLAAAAIDEVRATVERRLEELLAATPGAQVTTPLTVLRAAVAPVTELLLSAGVPPAARDPIEARIAPDDVYGIGPAAFADLGPDVAEAGLRWGAAVAHLHLAARRRSDADRASDA